LADGSFYQQTINGLHFGTIKTAEGKSLDVAQQRGEIENHPDPRVRSEGTKKLSDAYAIKRDVFALGLIQMIQLQNKIAQLHKFKNFREESYFEDYVSLQEIKNTYDEIAKESALYRRFEKIQDQARNSTAAQNPRFSIVETSQIVKKAVAPLGEEYVSEMSKLLDPKNGRIDIVRAENRLPMQGGASVYPIGISTFFAFNYEGFYIDVMLIAHEAGHAVQAMLMSSNHVPMAYAAGPGYFTESFGRFNEFIVADYLAKHEPDPLRKKYFVRQFAERAFALFPSAIEASVESEIHQGIEDEQIRNADDIDRITQLTGSKYSDAFKSNPERKMMWMDAPEYYVAPLHKMHNVFASVLALKYYQMYTQNPKDFASRYMALLRNGYNASPDVLLKKFLNIDFRDPELTNDALTFLLDQLRQLESN
jgi:oligoendopeptidase F